MLENGDQLIEAAKLYGPGFYMFMILNVMVLSGLLYAVRRLYLQSQEKDIQIKEKDEANLETLKDLVHVLDGVKDSSSSVAPQVIGEINNFENRLNGRIDRIEKK